MATTHESPVTTAKRETKAHELAAVLREAGVTAATPISEEGWRQAAAVVTEQRRLRGDMRACGAPSPETRLLVARLLPPAVRAIAGGCPACGSRGMHARGCPQMEPAHVPLPAGGLCPDGCGLVLDSHEAAETAAMHVAANTCVSCGQFAPRSEGGFFFRLSGTWEHRACADRLMRESEQAQREAYINQPMRRGGAR